MTYVFTAVKTQTELTELTYTYLASGGERDGRALAADRGPPRERGGHGRGARGDRRGRHDRGLHPAHDGGGGDHGGQGARDLRPEARPPRGPEGVRVARGRRERAPLPADAGPLHRGPL